MYLSENIKTEQYIGSNISEVIRDVSENLKTFVVTQNGEAKAIILDIKEYERIQDSISMMKYLSISENDYKNGNYESIDEAFADIEESIKQSYEL